MCRAPTSRRGRRASEYGEAPDRRTPPEVHGLRGRSRGLVPYRAIGGMNLPQPTKTCKMALGWVLVPAVGSQRMVVGTHRFRWKVVRQHGQTRTAQPTVPTPSCGACEDVQVSECSIDGGRPLIPGRSWKARTPGEASGSGEHRADRLTHPWWCSTTAERPGALAQRCLVRLPTCRIPSPSRPVVSPSPSTTDPLPGGRGKGSVCPDGVRLDGMTRGVQ